MQHNRDVSLEKKKLEKKSESSGLYSDDIRNDVFYAIHTDSVEGDVFTFRV